jgi:hypothetical protein
LQQQNRPYALHPIKINYLAIFIYWFFSIVTIEITITQQIGPDFDYIFGQPDHRRRRQPPLSTSCICRSKNF